MPAWANNDLVRPLSGNSNKILGDTAVIILTTPYCIGTLLAMFFNAVIPYDEDEEPEEEQEPLKPSQAPPPQMMPEMAPIPILYNDPMMSGFPMGGQPMPMNMGMPGMYPGQMQPMGGFA